MRRTASPSALAVLLALAACRAPVSPATNAAAAACPRDATVDAQGRCACTTPDVPLLGACVPPTVADAFCGPVARATTGGACAYPPCNDDEALDVDQGCVPLFSLHSGGPASCPDGTSLVVADRRLACVPADAACPAGTRSAGPSCVYPPTCPPGSLFAAGTCQPIVHLGPGAKAHVDVPAWALVVLGVDGGLGSAELCRSFRARPAALGLAPGETLTLRLRVTLSIPDGDVSRVSAQVAASATHVLPASAVALAEQTVNRLVEPLRGLGGEASTSRVELAVECR